MIRISTMALALAAAAALARAIPSTQWVRSDEHLDYDLGELYAGQPIRDYYNAQHKEHLQDA